MAPVFLSKQTFLQANPGDAALNNFVLTRQQLFWENSQWFPSLFQATHQKPLFRDAWLHNPATLFPYFSGSMFDQEKKLRKCQNFILQKINSHTSLF